ncbi:MAG: PDZ domain-containing protein, partial [Candidatus Hydrogenedentes bacterium]|nr:PDZ domain-containing protein [Candidatus Hydrogenedentota bacterium]
GEVERSWLGVQIQPRLRRQSQEHGVLVSSVYKDSPADAAGLKAGDLITNLAGEAIDVEYPEQLPPFNSLVAGLPIGQELTIVVLREGEEMTLTATTRKREDIATDEYEFKQWGLTVRNISSIVAKELKLDSTDGAMVTSVRGGGPSGEAKPSISAGDIIRKAGELEIKQVQDLRDATDTITEGATEPVPALITFERDTEEYVTVVKVGIRDIEDPGREVQKAWLPVETQVITRDIAEEMDKAELTGFRITKLYAGSTAETAGLLVGDLLVDVDGEPLRANGPEDADELRELIRQYSIGATAELGVLRNGERITVPVELIRSPMLEREMKKYRDESFEFTARDITFFDKAREQWQEQQPGVLIVEVTPGGWADLGMLSVGDLLVQVNETGLHRVEDVETIMQKLEEAEPESVVFKVLRGVHTYYLEIEPRWEDQQLPGKE